MTLKDVEESNTKTDFVCGDDIMDLNYGKEIQKSIVIDNPRNKTI